MKLKYLIITMILVVSLMSANAHATTRLLGAVPIPLYSTYLDYTENKSYQDGFDTYIILDTSYNKDFTPKDISEFNTKTVLLSELAAIEYQDYFLEQEKEVLTPILSNCWKEETYKNNITSETITENITYECFKPKLIKKRVREPFNPVGFTFKANKSYRVVYHTHLKHGLGKRWVDIVPSIAGEDLIEYSEFMTDCNKRKNITITNTRENHTLELLEDSIGFNGINLSGLTFQSSNYSTEYIIADATNTTYQRQTLDGMLGTGDGWVITALNKNQSGNEPTNPDNNLTVYYDCSTNVGVETDTHFMIQDFEGLNDGDSLENHGFSVIDLTSNVVSFNANATFPPCSWCGNMVGYINATAAGEDGYEFAHTGYDGLQTLRISILTYGTAINIIAIESDVPMVGYDYDSIIRNEAGSRVIVYFDGSYKTIGFSSSDTVFTNISITETPQPEQINYSVNGASGVSNVGFPFGNPTTLGYFGFAAIVDAGKLIDNIDKFKGWGANDTHKSTITLGDEVERLINREDVNVTVWLNDTNNDRTINYYNSNNATATSNNSAVILYRNGTEVSNPDEGIYGSGGYNFSANFTINNTIHGTESWQILNIQQATDDGLQTFINNTTPAYPTGVKIGCGDSKYGEIVTLRLNGTTLTNNTEGVYGKANQIWNVSCSTDGSINVSDFATESTFTYTKATPLSKLFLNESQSNTEQIYGDNITFNATATIEDTRLIAEIEVLLLWNNTADILGSADTIENLTKHGDIGIGGHSYSAHLNGSENYTDFSENFTIHIIDTTAPTIEVISPSNSSYPTNQTLNFIYVEELPNVCYFEINNNGTNATLSNCDTNGTAINLPEGNHFIDLYINDTSGNTGTDRQYFTYDFSIPTLIVYSPDNITYINNSILLNFTAFDNFNNELWYYYFNNSILYEHDGITNNTYYTKWINMSSGNKNITIIISDNASNYSLSNFTSLIYYNVSDITYTPLIYEMETDRIEYNITIGNNIVNITRAVLNHNNTDYQHSELFTDNAGNYTIRFNVTIPIIPHNNTNSTFFLGFDLTYDNATVDNQSSVSDSQARYFGNYILTFTKSEYRVLEGQDFKVNTTIFNKINNSYINVSVYANNSHINNSALILETTNGRTYQSIMNMGVVTTNNNTFIFNSILNISFGGIWRTENSSVDSINVFKTSLTNCSAFSVNVTLNLTTKDENHYDPVYSDLRTTLEIYNDNSGISNLYSFDIENATNFSICIYPSWAGYKLNATFQYEDANKSYEQRHYFLRGVSITNATNHIDLYLVNKTDGELINMYVEDANGNAAEDVIIKVQRYYVGENLYRTIAMGKTDFDGATSTYLQINDYWYKFILEQNGIVARDFSSLLLTDTSITFPLSPTAYLDYWQYYDEIAYTCSYDGTTFIVSCTVSDTSGLMNNVTIVAWQQEVIGETSVCGASSVSSTTTLACPLGNTTGKIYRYALSIETDSTYKVLEAEVLDFATENIYATTGLVLAFMFFVLLSFIGLFYPPVSIVLGLLSIVISYTLGLLYISYGAMFSIIFVGLIIIKKMRK